MRKAGKPEAIFRRSKPDFLISIFIISSVPDSAVYFAEHDIDAAEDHDGIGDGVAETHVLEHG